MIKFIVCLMAFLLILGTPNYIMETKEKGVTFLAKGFINMTRKEVNDIVKRPLSIFDKAVSIVLAQEGGYSNDESDNGGETKYGISKRAYPSIDIRNLTEEGAKEIYKRDYWDRYKYEKIGNDNLRIVLFSTCVNVGPRQCHLLLQRSINSTIKEYNLTMSPIKEDGILGNMTIEYANRLLGYQLKEELIKHLMSFYLGLATKDNSQVKFLKGWFNRAYDGLYLKD